MTDISQSQELPSLAKVQRVARTLEAKLMRSGCFGKLLDDAGYDHMTNIITKGVWRDVPGQNERQRRAELKGVRAAVVSSLQDYRYKYLDKILARELARLAGGLQHCFRQKEVVRDRQLAPGERDWCLLAVHDLVQNERQRGYDMHLKVLAGKMTGGTIIQRRGGKALQWLGRSIGFPRFRAVHPRDLMLTCFRADVGFDGRRFGFDEPVVGNSEKVHNKALYKVRHEPCIFGLDIPYCAVCVKTLTDCPNSCRRK